MALLTHLLRMTSFTFILQYNIYYIYILGLLIGPGGATQKNMSQRTGAKIIIRGRGASKDGAQTGHPDDDDKLHVSLEGTEQAIEMASNEINQIIYNPEQAQRLKQDQLKNLASINGAGMESIYGPTSSSSSDYQVELRVPNMLVGLIIGKGGENIQKMQIQTGAHMQIAKESDMKPGETLRSIVLKGSPDQVADLKRRVEEIITTRSNIPGHNPAAAGLGRA